MNEVDPFHTERLQTNRVHDFETVRQVDWTYPSHTVSVCAWGSSLIYYAVHSTLPLHRVPSARSAIGTKFQGSQVYVLAAALIDCAVHDTPPLHISQSSCCMLSKTCLECLHSKRLIAHAQLASDASSNAHSSICQHTCDPRVKLSDAHDAAPVSFSMCMAKQRADAQSKGSSDLQYNVCSHSTPRADWKDRVGRHTHAAQAGKAGWHAQYMKPRRIEEIFGTNSI